MIDFIVDEVQTHAIKSFTLIYLTNEQLTNIKQNSYR